LRQRSST
jgi:hypothetical protein